MSQNAPSFDLVKLLSDNDLGISGDDLAGMEWMPGIDEQTLVLDTNGVPADLKEQYEQPTFQILVRGGKGKAGIDTYNKARLVYELLISQGDVEINGTCYKEFEPLSSLAGIGRDENDRHVYTMNFSTYRNPV